MKANLASYLADGLSHSVVWAWAETAVELYVDGRKVAGFVSYSLAKAEP